MIKFLTLNQKVITAFLSELKVKPTYKGTVWDDESDNEKLRKGVAEFGEYFKAVVDKYFTVFDKEGQETILKTAAQCQKRWSIVLDPELSRDARSEAEHLILLELVIQEHLRLDPNLDIDKIIEREESWPDVNMSNVPIAAALELFGYNKRHIAAE
jgi:hypothetical protein